MLDALCERLLDNPGLYHHEMVDFVWDKFHVLVTVSSIKRALNYRGWSKKKTGRIAKARNADLRDPYSHNTSHIRSWQYVFVAVTN